jgi:hypothetical protein
MIAYKKTQQIQIYVRKIKKHYFNVESLGSRKPILTQLMNID